MKIIQVYKPAQDEFSTDVQFIVNKKGEIVYPSWRAKTERIREKDGGYLKWIKDKEIFCRANNIEGIFLYNITALNQTIMSTLDEPLPPEIVYYIRFDFIKSDLC